MVRKTATYIMKSFIFFLLKCYILQPLIRITGRRTTKTQGLIVEGAFRRIAAVVRRAAKTRGFIVVIADTRLRLQFDLPFSGEDKSLDEKLSKIIADYFDWGDGRKQPFANGKGNEYADWLLNDSSANSDRETYFRLSHWLSLCTVNHDTATQISSAYSVIYNKEIEIMDESDVRKSYDIFRKKCRSHLRLLRKSKAKLIDFSSKELLAFFPLISTLFVVGGYFHTSLVYRSFNVEPHHFFLMSDYLAGSIEKIWYAFGSLGGFILGVLRRIRNSATITEHESQERRKRSRWINIGLLAPCIIYLLLVLLPNNPIEISTFPDMTMISIFVILQTPIFFVSIRYFKNWASVYSFFMILTIFFSSLYASALREINEIREGRPEITFEIRSEEMKYTEKNSIFIGSNSRYVFLYDQRGKTKVFPLNRIEHISLETQ